MKKRDFIKVSGALATGAVISPLLSSCKMESKESMTEVSAGGTPIVYELPKLGYGYDALEPNIDARTMEIHYTKHHAGYTAKLNTALEANATLAATPITELLAGLSDDVSTAAVRNNGGGFYNHGLFWSIMGPNAGGQPSGDLADAINSAFGSFDTFIEEFSTAAKTVFGSGWAWLCKDAAGKLFVTKTPNQDNPLMVNLVEKAGTPILGIDVWEHAYYLKYQNLRGDYIKNFFKIVNWNAVAKNLG